MRLRIVDPSPMGYVYGFPKPCPEHITNLGEWAVENGYPRHLLEVAVFRTWYADYHPDGN